MLPAMIDRETEQTYRKMNSAADSISHEQTTKEGEWHRQMPRFERACCPTAKSSASSSSKGGREQSVGELIVKQDVSLENVSRAFRGKQATPYAVFYWKR